jgi:hypothetical protein
MGSFGDASSHSRLHKLFRFPDVGFYAAACGRIDRAAELTQLIYQNLRTLDSSARTYGACHQRIALSCFIYKRDRFMLEELPKAGIAPSLEELVRVVTPGVDSALLERWQGYNFGCDLIVGFFDTRGRAHLFCSDATDLTLQNCSYPGFAAVGSGADNAMFWLSYRQHTQGMGMRRSAYHAYEAKLMAEKSAHVNEHVEVLLASATERWYISTHRKGSDESAPVTLAELADLYEQYGPRSTLDIETMTLELGKSAGQP